MFKKVVAHHKRKNTNKTWIDLICSKQVTTKRLVCTTDHLVASTDNLFDPTNISFIEAKDMLNRYTIRQAKYNTTNKKHNINYAYSKDLISFAIGTILGDSHLSKNGNMQIVHCLKQKEYVELKQNLFGGTLRDFHNKGFNNKTFNKACMLITPSNEQTKELRSLFYNNNNKIVENILSFIDEKSLAFWYMDDGNISRMSNGNQYAIINTQSFDKYNHILLTKMFKEKFNIYPRIDTYTMQYNNEIKTYQRLRFTVGDTKKLFSLISKYIIPSMSYKLGNFPQEKLFNYSECVKMPFALLKVREIKTITKDFNKKYLSSDLYDIEVEDTHNFIANDTLVHNCHILHKKRRICHHALQGDVCT